MLSERKNNLLFFLLTRRVRAVANRSRISRILGYVRGGMQRDLASQLEL
jgi:hypothetical protein